MTLSVRDVMTASLIAVDASAAVHDARRLLEQQRLSAVPVIDAAGRPVGILSATDLLSNLEPGLPVRRVMTDHVYTVAEHEEVATAARLMLTRRVHRLVVTDGQRATGVVSALDLLPLVAGDRPRDAIPPVGLVMTANPHAIDRDDSLLRARALMVQHGVRHLAVQHGAAVLGMISDRDLKRALDPDLGLPPKAELFVRDVFVPGAYQVGPAEPLDRVVGHMAEHHIGSALVVDDGCLVGILTATDACRLLAEHLRSACTGPRSREIA